MRPGYGECLVLEGDVEAQVASAALACCCRNNLAEEVLSRYQSDRLAGNVVLNQEEGMEVIRALAVAALFRIMPPKRSPRDYLPRSGYRCFMKFSSVALATLESFRPSEGDTFSPEVAYIREKVEEATKKNQA